jgi:hypothetical protein
MLMRGWLSFLVLALILVACKPQPAGPRAEELQPLLGKTVREVAIALQVPASALRAGDEPPGVFRFVSGYFTTEPIGRMLTVYVSREAAVISPNREATAADLLDKPAVGIAVTFPVADKRPDVVVGNAIGFFHQQP